MFGRAGPIEPLAKVGEKVLLVGQRKFYLYYVAFREPIQVSHPLLIEISAGAGIAAGATLPAFNTTAILDLADGQLGQFRAFVLDDIHVEVLQPFASTRQVLANVNATINAFSRLEDPCDHLTEFAIFEDERIFLRATNPTRYAVAQARMVFYGNKYALAGPDGSIGTDLRPLQVFDSIEAVKKSGAKYTAVPIGGWDR